MESASQTCARLVTALEDLAEQELAALQTRNFAAVVEIQDRAAPLVAHLAAHEKEITATEVRARVVALHARRQRTGEWLAEQIEQTRQELSETHVAKRRVAQVGPAYGAKKMASRQFSATG